MKSITKKQLAKIIHVSSIGELDNYFSTQDTENCNYVGYMWHEYGFFITFYTEIYREFFLNVEGKIIATCFPGHEMFLENKVDELIVLDGFIDTSKTYVNNKESKLLKQNMLKYRDNGQAFWYTLKNFDEDEFDEMLNRYKFKNILFPLGRTTKWDKGLYITSPNFNGYKYASGEKDYWFDPTMAYYYKHGHTGWNEKYKDETPLWEDGFPLELKGDTRLKNYPREEMGDYSVIFVKNSWKTRKGNGFVGDGTEGNPGFGFLKYNLFDKIVNKFISEKRKLVIINDLVKYPIPDSEYIKEFNMDNFLDVKRYLALVYNSNLYMSSSTSIMDLVVYYTDTNYIGFDDKDRNFRDDGHWMKIIKQRGNKAISIDSKSTNDWDKLSNFIDEVWNDK
mgnify:CR=1 FL=1